MSLPGISAAKAGYSVDNFADMAREAASTCDSGEDSVMVAGDVRPDEKGKFVSGTGVGAHRWVVLGKRSEAFGQNNLAMRRAFLAAVKNELGIQDLKDLPKDVRKALCLGDFRLKDGEVTSTRPLTARRVLKVTAELQKIRTVESQRFTEAFKAEWGAEATMTSTGELQLRNLSGKERLAIWPAVLILGPELEGRDVLDCLENREKIEEAARNGKLNARTLYKILCPDVKMPKVLNDAIKSGDRQKISDELCRAVQQSHYAKFNAEAGKLGKRRALAVDLFEKLGVKTSDDAIKTMLDPERRASFKIDNATLGRCVAVRATGASIESACTELGRNIDRKTFGIAFDGKAMDLSSVKGDEDLGETWANRLKSALDEKIKALCRGDARLEGMVRASLCQQGCSLMRSFASVKLGHMTSFRHANYAFSSLEQNGDFKGVRVELKSKEMDQLDDGTGMRACMFDVTYAFNLYTDGHQEVETIDFQIK